MDIRRSGLDINVKTIIAYLYSIDDFFKKENINIGQLLLDNATDLIYDYLYKIINKRRLLNINDQELFRIIICDETAI